MFHLNTVKYKFTDSLTIMKFFGLYKKNIAIIGNYIVY